MQENQVKLINNLLSGITTNLGNTLEDLSFKHPVLLVFLRHFGCVFCLEGLRDISKKRQSFIDKGIKIVFVHLADDKTAIEYFEKYNLQGIEYISDPECNIYSRFGLTKGSFTQLYGLQVMLRGFEATLLKGNKFSLKQIGDGFQMPGIFLLKDGKIRDSFVHNKISDKPDYIQLTDCC